jgi:pimeloyl-ACP methyl ester carboxylesterase
MVGQTFRSADLPITKMTRPNLLLFPGLGVDARVYAPQRNLPVNLEIIEWIEPQSADESLAHYAERMSAVIGPSPNHFVGGISLGSMVALEVASRINARGVFVIGGCSSHRQISPLFKGVLGIGATMPTSAIHPSLRLAPVALRLLEGLSNDQANFMTAMLRAQSPPLIRWSCRAILQWECCAMPPDVPIHAIHGQNDEVIPLSNVKANHVVPYGRHLISLTHPREVNRFILEQVVLA